MRLVCIASKDGPFCTRVPQIEAEKMVASGDFHYTLKGRWKAERA